MLHTAEWVSPNHPDKICDFISDSILDACLAQDPFSRVAIETQAGHGTIFLAWELTTKAMIDVIDVAKEALQKRGIDHKEVTIVQNIEKQSPDIAKGVDTGGAGDQGIMVGYACRDSEDQLPIEYSLARGLGLFIYEKYGSNKDLKTQVTVDVEYPEEKEKSARFTVNTVLVSAEWFENNNQIMDDIQYYFNKLFLVTAMTKIIINPCGQWKGGIDTDAGVTGRKIVVDQYGPRVPVGGGAFSGKDPTKVDRSAAYMARKVAKEILRDNPIAREVVVKVAYAIGLDYPLSLTAVADGNVVLEPTQETLERFKPESIIRELGLRAPIYAQVVTDGVYGNKNNTWEQL